jgi:hypothetical protein
MPAPMLDARQQRLLGRDHGSLEQMKVLMENSSPAARRRTLVDNLEMEHKLQHSPKVLARFFDGGYDEAAAKEDDEPSTCSVSASATSSLDDQLLTSPVRPTAAIPGAVLDQSRCYSPYYLDRSSVVSPRPEPEEDEAVAEDKENATAASDEHVSTTARHPQRARHEMLVRRKSRQMIQKLQNFGKKMRKSEQPEESELGEDDLAAAVETLRKDVALAEDRVALAEKNMMATLRTERERLEMRLRLLHVDTESRHALSDQLSKEQAKQQPRRAAASARPAVPAVSRAGALEETVMREWTALPPEALRITCTGRRVRRWLGGQATRSAQRGARETELRVVLCCVLRHLSSEDVARLKQASRLCYNVCSLYFRAKPISDLAVELINSEAMYNAFLRAFLAEYRNPIAALVPPMSPSDVAAVFGPVERVAAQSARLLGALQTALATAQPFRSDVAGCFVEEVDAIERDYAFFCESYPAAHAASEALLQQRAVQEALGKDATSLTFDSFLIMPVQRVPRYLLMMQSMLRKTSPRMPSHEPLLMATELLQSCAASINHRMQEAEDASQLEQFLQTVSDTPRAGIVGAKLVVEQSVVVNGKPALLALLSDRVLIAHKNSGKSSTHVTAPWRFRSMHVLQNCHARMYDDPRFSKVQILTEDEALMCVFEAHEDASAWLAHFSACLVEQLKYHPRSARVHKLAAPRMTLTRFSQMDGQVLVRPVVPRVASVSTQHAYLLDADNKLFIFAGRDSSAAEQIAAEEFLRMLLAEADTRAISVLRVTDEKRSAQFFDLLGGDASLVSREAVQVVPPAHLSVFQDQLAYPRPTLFSFSSLPENGCALVDARSGPCFVWAALHSPPALRDRAIRFAQETYSGQAERPVEFVLAGAEPALFKMLFQDWPGKESGAPTPSSASAASRDATPATTPAPTPVPTGRKKTIFSTIGRSRPKQQQQQQKP